MANRPEDKKPNDGEEAVVRQTGRLPRPKQPASDRMLRPNGRKQGYETK